MQPAIVGIAVVGQSRIGVYRNDWDVLVKAFSQIASFEVTWRRLILYTQDLTTGWYDKGYKASKIDAIIFAKGATSSLLPPGTYVRTDALGLIVDPVEEGDELVVNNQYYEVETVQPYSIGDSFYYRKCDLTLLPFKNLTGTTYAASNAQDARYRTKYYLDYYLDKTAVPNCLVCYANPPYSLIRVFKDKGKNVIFTLGEPDSTPLLGADHYAYGYNEKVPIQIQTVDKEGVSGTQLKWNAEAELRRVLETYPLGSLRSMERRREIDRSFGSTKIYGTEFVLNYTRGVT